MRISCDMFARNSLLAALADSACSAFGGSQPLGRSLAAASSACAIRSPRVAYLAPGLSRGLATLRSSSSNCSRNCSASRLRRMTSDRATKAQPTKPSSRAARRHHDQRVGIPRRHDLEMHRAPASSNSSRGQSSARRTCKRPLCSCARRIAAPSRARARAGPSSRARSFDARARWRSDAGAARVACGIPRWHT